MDLEEIVGHIVAGETVHWKSDLYKVEAWYDGMMIVCQTNGHAIGLMWTDGVTLNVPYPLTPDEVVELKNALGKIDYTDIKYPCSC